MRGNRADWERRMACCDSQPQCGHCPLLEENRHRSLKDLAMAALDD